MELEKLEAIGFLKDEKGLYFNEIDGFLYTAQKTENVIISVNLPDVSQNEKKMIKGYLQESVLHFMKLSFVREGIIITFQPQLLEDIDYALQLFKQFSAFLKSEGVEFSNAELNTVFNKRMYVFAPIAAPIEAKKTASAESKAEEAPKNKIDALIDKLSNQWLGVIIFALCTVIYFALLVLLPQIAAAAGYLMGMAPTYVFVRRRYPIKKIVLYVLVITLSSLIVATFYAFLVQFLTQTEIYYVKDFIIQSLKPSYCMFDFVLAFLLAVFGLYSTLPSNKKPKVKEEEDFE